MPIPVMETLSRINNGQLLADIQRELANVVASVHATDKVGTLTLKLSIKPMKETGAVAALYDIKGAPPRPDNATLFFPDAEGSLHRSHPNQRDIFEARGEKEHG